MKLFRCFLNSILQYFAFGCIFLGCLSFIYYIFDFWLSDVNASSFVNVFYLLSFFIPIASACGWCFFINRHNFFLRLEKSISKLPIYKLIIRLASIFCCLLAGYIVCTSDLHNKVLIFSEGLNRVISLIVDNFLFYLIVAIFPTTFALVEYMFVKPNTDH